jgi:hypothetical protein
MIALSVVVIASSIAVRVISRSPLSVSVSVVASSVWVATLAVAFELEVAEVLGFTWTGGSPGRARAIAVCFGRVHRDGLYSRGLWCKEEGGMEVSSCEAAW